MRIILATFFIVTWLSITAQGQFKDGNELKKVYNCSQNADLCTLVQFPGIETADAKTIKGFREQERLLALGEYYSYIAGVVDLFEATFESSIPTTVTLGQLVEIVGKYLKNHPEEWHKSGAKIVINSILEAFPPARKQ